METSGVLLGPVGTTGRVSLVTDAASVFVGSVDVKSETVCLVDVFVVMDKLSDEEESATDLSIA